MIPTTRRSAAALLLPLLALACQDSPTGPAEAAPPADAATFAREGVSSRLPIQGNVWNECTGETVRVTGEINRVFSMHVDQGGGYHWLSNYMIHGSAVGLSSGNQYVYNEIHNMKENGDLPFDALFDDTGAYYFTMSFISTLISKGALPNELFQWDIRFKMNRAGEVTIDEFRYEVLCRG